uniref:histidine kinase n=1 Tax=Tetradesmus obliquus TaxID=3088 RepID=A0A383WHH1_TETOB|eukprot:jgi/Sobl393_1/1821/SZX76176.1
MRSLSTRSEPLNLSWFTHLVLSYASCTLLLHQLVGGPGLAEAFRSQVPLGYHLLSCAAFGTAFALDLLAVLFYARSSRLELTLLPAWIKGLPFLSSVLMASGKAVVAQAANGRLVNLQRYVCWMHTTPAVMYLIKSVSNSITTQQMYSIILLHEVQLGLGAVAKLSGGVTQVLLGGCVHCALIPVLMFLHTGLKELSVQYSKNTAAFVYLSTLVTYGSFGVVWDLGSFGLLSPAQEEAAYLWAELASKILISTVLLFSNFVTRDMRRLALMRSIEAQSRQQLIAELRALVAQKDAFMSSVSHELRTPLNGIIGLSEAALHNSDLAQQAGPAGAPHVLPPATRQQLALIRTSGLRLLSLVNDILDAAALQHSRLVLARGRVVLRPLVEEVADISRPLLRDRALRLVTRVPHDLEVLGDADRIVQVLNNLVSNAAKFTEAGTITISARVGRQPPHNSSSSRASSRAGSRPGSSSGARLKPSGSGAAAAAAAAAAACPQEVVLVSVEDTGLGIPEEKLQAVFEAFEQVHTHISRSQRGLGLGLSIVRQLVDAMGGSISASSVVGSGTTFTFSLPLYTPEAAAAAAAGAAAQASAQVPAPEEDTLAAAAAAVSAKAMGSSSPSPSAAASRSAAGGGAGQRRLLTDRQAVLAMGSAAVAASYSAAVATAGGGRRGSAPAVGGTGAMGAMGSLAAELAGLAASVGFGGGGGGRMRSAGGSLPDAAAGGGSPAAAAAAGWDNMLDGGGNIGGNDGDNADGVHDGNGGDDDDSWALQQPLVPSPLAGRRSDVAAVLADEQAAAALPHMQRWPQGGSQQQQQQLSRERSSIPAMQFHSQVKGGRVQLLVVDDDPLNHQVLSLLLEAAGFSLVHVMSGAATLAFLAACELLPDLVLLDVAMPGMDGRETCCRIRAAMAGSGLHLPIVMLTAQVAAQSVEDSLSAGADDHLSKPCTRQELMAAIARNCKKQQRL